MADVTAKKADGKTSIVIEGEATIETIADTYEALLKAYTSAKSIEIHCHELNKADISFVQLMISLIKTAQKDNKPCVIASLSDTVHALITATGYERVCREHGISQSH